MTSLKTCVIYHYFTSERQEIKGATLNVCCFDFQVLFIVMY